MPSIRIEVLKCVNDYYAACMTLWNDLWAAVESQSLSTPKTTADQWLWGIGGRPQDQRICWVIEHQEKYRFAALWVKTKEDSVRKSSKYVAACNQLCLDPFYPQILLIGRFAPRDLKRFSESGRLQAAWVYHSLGLDIPDEVRFVDPAVYAVGSLIRVRTPRGTDSMYCEDAKLKVTKLSDIKNNKDVEALAMELLAL